MRKSLSIFGWALAAIFIAMGCADERDLDSHACSECLECEMCIETENGITCEAESHSYKQCSDETGNAHWFDSCDVQEDVADDCSGGHKVCADITETDAECQCTTNWEGDECETCPENWDPEQDCNVCLNHWVDEDNDCGTCPGNWDEDADCNGCISNWDPDENCLECLGNWDVVANCVLCENNWIDEKNDCGTCPGNWDATQDCAVCENNWIDEGNDCGTCPGNWDATEDCAVCENNWIDEGNDCGTCPGNWDATQDCAVCENNWIDEGNDCGTCPGNWDATQDCSACVGNFDESANCESCTNQWVDNGDDCGTCPGNWDAALDCNACETNWEGTNCETCPGNWDATQNCAICDNNWIDEGNDCGTCPANWDPAQDCAVCENNWIDESNNCGTCPGNWDETADCNSCVGNWDATGDCAVCENNWINESNDCSTCPGNWDAAQDCNACQTNWEGSDCETCPGNWDSTKNCGACENNWIDEANDCGTCPGNWDAAQDCAACATNWEGTDCETCPGNWDPLQNCNVCENHWEDNGNDCGDCPPNWDAAEDCNACLGNWDILSDCEACLDHWDIVTLCTTCENHWTGTDCNTCPPNWDSTQDCNACRNHWVDNSDDCGSCETGWLEAYDCATVCENGNKEPDEECDGDDLDGLTCADYALPGDALTCSKDDCTIVTSTCESCGDGQLDYNEECDDLNLDGETCDYIGFDNGLLGCGANCQFDTTYCDMCGNGELDGPEECDSTSNCSYCLVNGTLVAMVDYGTQGWPAIADTPGGGFIIAWEESALPEPSAENRIYARFFDDQGDPIEPTITVSDIYDEQGIVAGVATDTAGNFVVVWLNPSMSPKRPHVYARRYDSSGAALAPADQVNTSGEYSRSSAKIAMAGDGRFVVGWSSSLQDGDDYGAYARLFEADGTPVADEFRVNTSTTGRQHITDLDMADDGTFVVAWRDTYTSGSSYGAWWRRYDADGTPLGSPTRVTTETTVPRVAMHSDGSFVVGWSDDALYGQFYDSGGSAVGSTFSIEGQPSTSYSLGAIGITDAGTVHLLWQYFRSGGYSPLDDTTFVTIVGSDGVPTIERIRAFFPATYGDDQPSLLTYSTGEFVIAWAAEDDAGDIFWEIRFRRFAADGTVLGAGT